MSNFFNISLLRSFCGKRGIRTPGTVARTPHFECGPIDHSGIFPFKSVAKIGIFSLSCIVSGQKNAKKKTFYTCALNINKLHENNKFYLIDAWIKPAVMIAPGITTNIPIISGTLAK